MTRRELLTRRFNHPGLPRWELDARMREEHRRDAPLVPYQEWLAQEVDEQGRTK